MILLKLVYILHILAHIHAKDTNFTFGTPHTCTHTIQLQTDSLLASITFCTLYIFGNTDIHMHRYTNTCTDIPADTDTDTHRHMHTDTHKCTCRHTHTFRHICLHTQTHIQFYTYAHRCVYRKSKESVASNAVLSQNWQKLLLQTGNWRKSNLVKLILQTYPHLSWCTWWHIVGTSGAYSFYI